MISQMNYPQANLYISLSTPQFRAYQSGDVIRGVVRVDPRTRPVRVTIAFRGRMKFSISRSTQAAMAYHEEKANFFMHALELFSSATPSYDITGFGVTQDDRVDMPFEFQFPEQTELDPGPKWVRDKSARFHSEAGGLLPPTYIKPMGVMGDIAIKYFLEAKLFKTSGAANDYEAKCSLTFLPAPPPNILESLSLVHKSSPSTIQAQRGIWIRTHRLHPDYDPDEGLTDRIKHRWTKNKTTTPFVNFKIDVSYPGVLVPGCPMPLTLFLQHIQRSQEISEPPPIYLRRIRVKLLSTTHLRVLELSSLSYQASDGRFNETQDLLDIRFSHGDGHLLFDGLELPRYSIPTRITPTFQTYGIALDHAVQIQVWCECANETFERIIEPRGNVLVASRPRDPGAGQEMGDEQPPAMEEDDAPPPYEVT